MMMDEFLATADSADFGISAHTFIIFITIMPFIDFIRMVLMPLNIIRLYAFHFEIFINTLSLRSMICIISLWFWYTTTINEISAYLMDDS
jgi:hypothetical protein